MKYRLTPTIFFNHCFDKRRFNSFLHWFFKKSHHGHSRLLKFLEKIKLIGFHSATEAGFSIGIDDLKIPESKSSLLLTTENQVFETDFLFMAGNLTTIERYHYVLEIWNRTSEELKYQVLQSFKFSDFFNPVYFMAFSGARGNISQIRQLVAMRGLMTDPQGQVIDFPIRSNFREGLTLTEYLISCSGARKGIVDTALRTAVSGYLTRRLVDVAHQVIISQIDCHDSRGIIIEDLYDQKKKILSLKQRLIGRILAETIICPSKCVIICSKNQEISKKISQKICEIRQKVQIRSPLTCQSAQFVCQFCYGWNLAEGQLVSIGEAVGVLAAQSIGEPGTQLTMRTFHTGGVFTGILLDQTSAPFAGRIHYLFSCIGLLIRTQQGKIAYLTKNDATLKINNQQKKIQFIFQSGSLLYVKEGENIMQKQLMAELPFFEKENTNASETEQKILSLNSGEMYFENFVLTDKTKFDFLEQSKNYIKGINEFWILSAQFFSLLEKKRNSFFHGLDLADKLVPFTQVVLNFPHAHSNKYFVSDSIFFKTRGYLSKLNSKFSTLSTGLKFREIINFFQYRKNILFSWNTPWGKIAKYFLTTSYDIFPEFIFQTEYKSKKINQNLFIFFINRQGISKYITTKKINLNSYFQANKGNFMKYLFPKNFVKNFYPNWIRQKFQVKPRILHWKNIPTSQYIFVMNFLENKTQTFPYQPKQLKIGNNVYIRIFFCFKENLLNKKYSKKILKKNTRKKYSKKILKKNTQKKYSKKILKKNTQKNTQKKYSKKILEKNREYFSSNIIQEKWYFFGHKSKNPASTYLKNFVQKKKRLPLQDNDFLIIPSLNLKKLNFSVKKKFFVLKEILPHLIISQGFMQVDFTKIQQKTINFYFHIYCFFLKNFSFIKNFKIRFMNIKPQKPIQKFVNLRKQYSQYNEQSESISKKSLLFIKKRISINFQKYKIRYLKSTIPEKKQYSKFSKKSFNKTFFIFVSPFKCWTFKINNRNSLYSVNSKEQGLVGPAINFFINLRFLLFNRIKIIFKNWRYLKKINQKKSKKKFLPFPKLQNKIYPKLELVSILPISFHLKLFLKFQLLSEKNRSLLSKIKNINFKIIQKKFFYSFETQIFLRFFSFFTSSEIIDPLFKIKKYKNNVLFTNTEHYFAHSVFSIPNQKKKNFVFQISSIRNRKKLCLCLLGNKFYEKENFHKIPGSLFQGIELINNQFIFHGGLLVAKTCNTFLFRKAINYLLNDQNILYTYHGEIISKNQHLCSVFYNQSKIGDIVQGIPKIEEIFEARKKPKYNFPKFSRQFNEINKYLQNLQTSVINNIQRIYCGQGIHISDKHIEIIVRQMTSNVLILEPGQTGLLRGEIVAFRWIYLMNSELFSNQIIYEPILLGMTKTCLQTSSFLSAASFQETTRILSRAALQNKIDFLRGLKQNVILGKLMPIGTGYLE